MQQEAPLTISLILAVSAACQWIAWRTKIPGIVFLLVSGIMAGPVLNLLNPEALMGSLFFPFVSLSVALILFEGSLTLNFSEIRGMESVVRNMVSYGMLVTWVITALATRYALDLSWEICILFGAIATVSGPTVIVPMLRTVRPTHNIANILRWEGIIIDPIGAGMAVLTYEFILSASVGDAFSHTLFTFFRLVSIGVLAGAASGYLFGLLIRHQIIPIFLHNLSAVAAVIGIFVFSNMVQHESGLVAVTVMGMWLANMKAVPIEDMLDFKEHISILLISVLFILLAARLDLGALMGLGWGVVILFIAIQFLARPLNIMVSSIGSNLTWPERHMLAWIAPRGIVAAAISALFAVQLENAGFSDASVLVPLTFFVIIATVVLQSLTARPIAMWLKVAEQEPNGFIIIGANRVARAIGKALQDQGVKVLLADAVWGHVARARLEGLPCYYGSPVSAHAEKHISLIGMKGILAVSPLDHVNSASALHFKAEIGPEYIYILRSHKETLSGDLDRFSLDNHGYPLFSEDINFVSLSSTLSRGGEIVATELTDKFSFQDFLDTHGKRATCLFALDPKGNSHVFSQKNLIKAAEGWTIIYLNKATNEL